MLAVPTATAETTPCALTVATEGLSDDQVVFWSMTFPSGSFIVAVACVLEPTPIVGEARETATDATPLGAMVTVAEPLWPSLVAVMVAVPALSPLTTPDVLTLATAVLSDEKLTERPVRMLPLASLTVAVA
jgi:hypothetical protein